MPLRLSFFLPLAVAAALLPSLAGAHPHIFVDAKASLRFDAAGALETIVHEWTFDAGYSAWSIQGLDADRDGRVTRAELQPLADDNLLGLAEYRYYTYLTDAKGEVALGTGRGATIDETDGRTTLRFEVPLAPPRPIEGALALSIADPEYYVAINHADVGSITLLGAPANCRASLTAAQPLPDDLAAELYAIPADVRVLPPRLAKALLGTQGGIAVVCGGTPDPATALEAATALAEAAPNAAAPAGAAPVGAAFGTISEPGLNLPRDGIFGWIGAKQTEFYKHLIALLGALRADWTAFWVLGALSFLYGVFHAAGPGHGKIVVSSYMLANESQLRRGLWLSFAGAMAQALTAIGFSLVAAGLLGLTSLAMNDAMRHLDTLSYGLIALLGLWLVGRKFLGRRRDHHRDHDHHHGDHDHHGHEHCHVVTPAQAAGGRFERLSIVAAIGLRPCTGALVVLAFALSQGVLIAGIGATLLMGLGTALTTGALAALAVGAKGLARRLAGPDNALPVSLLWWVELVAALAVLGFGAAMLAASL